MMNYPGMTNNNATYSTNYSNGYSVPPNINSDPSYAQFYQQAAYLNSLQAQVYSMQNPSDEYDDEPTTSTNKDKKSKKLEMYGNKIYNLNTILAENILAAEYFKSLFKYKTYHEVIQEIKGHVFNVEPFMVGSVRSPSTAFCLLYKFFTMRLTIKQMDGLLKSDNIYVKCIGFLYLRYTCPPKELYEWFEPYLENDTVFSPGADKTEQMTLGEYLEKLLTELNYYSTIFPRIPVPVQRDISKKMLARSLKKQKTSNKNEKIRNKIKVGCNINCLWKEDSQFYPAIVIKVLNNGKFKVKYDGFDDIEEVDIDSIKLIEKSHSRSRSRSRSSYHRSRKRSSSRSPSYHRSRKRSSSRSPTRSSYHRSRKRSSSRDRYHRHKHSRYHQSKNEDKNKSYVMDEKDLEAEVLRMEREKAAAKGKDYAKRVTGVKPALIMPLSVGTARKRSKSKSPIRQLKTLTRSRSKSRSPPRKKKMSAAAQKARLELIKKYGDASNN